MKYRVSWLDDRTNLKSFALWHCVEQRSLCRNLAPECHCVNSLQSQSEKKYIITSHVFNNYMPVSSWASQVEMPVNQILVKTWWKVLNCHLRATLLESECDLSTVIPGRLNVVTLWSLLCKRGFVKVSSLHYVQFVKYIFPRNQTTSN